MNNFNYYNGGVPLKQDDIKFIMDEIKNITAQPYINPKQQIITGMINVLGAAITPGLILGPNQFGSGELFYFPLQTFTSGFSGATMYLDYIDTPDDSRLYADNNTHNFHQLRTAYLTTTPIHWTGTTLINWTDLNTNERVDTKMYHILNNKLNWNNGDIYTNNYNLGINSYYGVSANTDINLYGGDIQIGGNKTQTLNIKSSINMIDSGLTTLFNSNIPSSAQTILVAEPYDRIIYTFPSIAFGATDVVSVYLFSKRIGVFSIGSSCTIHLAGGCPLIFVLDSGTSSQIVIQEQKYGKR